MILLIPFLFCAFLPVGSQSLNADCDSDFASLAMGLVQASIPEERKLRLIEAILSSCNKPILQKLSEVSVHILKKGVIQPPLLSELKTMAADIRKNKLLILKRMSLTVDGDLKPVFDYLPEIYGNDSLSGNEKTHLANSVISTLPRERQVAAILLLNSVVKITPFESLKFVNSANSEITQEKIKEINADTEKPSTPASFPIHAEPSSSSEPGPPSMSINKFNIKLPSIEDDKKSVISSFPIQPIKPIVTSKGQLSKPSVLSKTNDADLLTPRNSIWTEATKVLEESTNLPETLRQLLKASSLSHVRNNDGVHFPTINTFPLPAEAYQQLLQNSIAPRRLSREHLPFRQNDAPLALGVPSSSSSLSSYDTQLDRFAKGDKNSPRFQLPENWDWMLPNREHKLIASTSGQSTASEFSTTPYPDYVATVPSIDSPLSIAPTGTVKIFEEVQSTYAPGPFVPTTTGINHVDRFPNFPSINQLTTTEEPFRPYDNPEKITEEFRRQQLLNSMTRPRFQLDLFNE